MRCCEDLQPDQFDQIEAPPVRRGATSVLTPPPVVTVHTAVAGPFRSEAAAERWVDEHASSACAALGAHLTIHHTDHGPVVALQALSRTLAEALTAAATLQRLSGGQA